MTELSGIDADRVSMSSWMLCSMLAGLAGVLLAPLFAAVADVNYTTLVVVAMSAAVFAGLTNIPVAFFGGLGARCHRRGRRRVPADQQRAREQPAARAAVPRPVPRVDPLAGVAQPARARRSAGGGRSRLRPQPAAHGSQPVPHERHARLRRIRRVLIVGYYIFFHAADELASTSRSTATILATIFLSITVITGHGGRDLSVHLDVRGDRCVHDRAARDTVRSVGAPRPCSSARRSTALVGGIARVARAAARRHLPLAGDLRVRAVLRERAWSSSTGSAAARFPRRRPRPTLGFDQLRYRDATRAFSFSASSCSWSWASSCYAIREGTTGRVLAALGGSEAGGRVDRYQRDACRGSPCSRCRRRSRRSAAGCFAMYERVGELQPRTSCTSRGCSGSCSSFRSAAVPSRVRSRPRSASRRSRSSS